MKVLEMYYKVRDLSVLLRFSRQWVLEKIKAGEFGNDVFLIGSDYRVPASAVNAFLERHRFNHAEGIKARNRGELLRKLRQQAAEEQIQDGP